MIKLYSLLFSSLLLFSFLNEAQAQSKVNGSVKGALIDAKTKAPVEYAAIAVRSLTDSLVVSSALSNSKGLFTVNNVPAGNYRLTISFIGYQTIRKPISITPENRELDLGTLSLDASGINLNEVLVKGEKDPVKVKQDTLEFNAGSFKTRENAPVEDLLKKLPGVEVDKDGNIKAQGETVKKVLVDGKEFFGSDPKLATKNLPADMIDKVQVIDKKSDQAEFSKIDDGSREKVINLTV